ncbi:uncharacterized protein LOC134601390 [Pelobates fuscus]|uniref:uncharacterized protein LOC134601390 n=1 Tax=Pelobates fuscus TaxID=191477 RepID=UPI002FE4F601
MFINLWISSARMHYSKHLLVVTIVIWASAAQFLDEEWILWKSKYGKKYATKQIEVFHRNTWEATWHKVQKHNQLAEQGLQNYTLTMNHFADMNQEELNSYKGLQLKRRFPPSNHSKIHQGKLTNVPDEFDWRKTECVTPVGDQGQCGASWAFATAGIIETRYCVEKHVLVELSKQQLVDCDMYDDGCNEGHPLNALVYISNEKGIMRNEDYTYLEKKSKCLYDETKAIKFSETDFYYVTGEDNMAISVAQDGPITVLIAISEEFMQYSTGIFDGSCPGIINHAVIIVGYGSETSGHSPDIKQDYWIIKNSWGEGWGEGGYARMKRNVNQCKIASEAVSMDFTVA